MTPSAHLGLGSNLGDRRGFLQQAVDALRARGITPLASSSVYESAPVGLVLDQPAFLNAVIAVATDLAPLALLDAVKEVEGTLGRQAGPRHGPRVIDIDIIMMGEVTYVSDRLTVPHPEFRHRRFVLEPLHELGRCRELELDREQDVVVAGPPLDVGGPGGSPPPGEERRPSAVP